MSNGQIIYFPDGSTPTTYQFAVNIGFGLEIGPIDLMSRKRALDGTAYVSIAGNKGHWSIPFNYVSLAQFEAFQAAYESGYVIELYLDAAQAKTADVIFSEPPRAELQQAYRSGQVTYSFTAEFEEA